MPLTDKEKVCCLAFRMGIEKLSMEDLLEVLTEIANRMGELAIGTSK